MPFIYRRPTIFPRVGQEVGPDVPGKIIATWTGKNRTSLITYLFDIKTEQGEKLVATTDPRFNPAEHPTVPLVCFLSATPESPDDWIEICNIQVNHVRGDFYYEED